MKKGKFIGVGVGPGDPELLTLKAVRILNQVHVICAPKSAETKPSLALSIVGKILKNRNDQCEILEPLFPMIEDKKALREHWDKAAELILEKINQGLDVAFVTLGDPTIYSTFSYVYSKINDHDLDIEIIPGITSFTGCAASVGLPLAEKDEIMVVVPKVDARLGQILEHGDTFVIMKTSRHTDLLEDIINQDERYKEIISVQNCSMEDEKIIKGFTTDKKYLSTTIVKFREKK